MAVTGELLLGGSARRGTNGVFKALDPKSGASLPGEFGGASIEDLKHATALASEASMSFRAAPLSKRAGLLDAIADEILALGDELVQRCVAETSLAQARVEGERMRTVGQLRMFAEVVRDGSFLGVRIEAAQPDRIPSPKPDLRLRSVPIGPIAVFGASNFPLAFSVAGGDTASAIAAGCPVIVKAHSAHLGTSELVGRAIQKAVRKLELHPGLFSLLYDAGYTIGQALVSDDAIKGVGFTGSRAGGLKLMEIAAARHQPIPVYAEMSSINPVVLFPEALAKRGKAIGEAFAGALTLGVGQFCTNPGLVVGVKSAGLDAFVAGASQALAKVEPAPMLTSQISAKYQEGLSSLSSHANVSLLAEGAPGGDGLPRASIFGTTAETFLSNSALQDEVFGPASLVVSAVSWDEVEQVLAALDGQLTAAIHIQGNDEVLAKKMLPKLENLVGRIVVNGFGTGVEVGHPMVHGGPYPATSDGRTTSVGSLAVARFLRPVCYQDFPDTLLPVELR